MVSSAMPPVVVNSNGVKVACSTSMTLLAYMRLIIIIINNNSKIIIIIK